MAHSEAPLLIAFLLAGIALLPLAARAPDPTPPWAATWGPMGTNVPTDTHIFVGWSERMDWPSVEIAFTYTDGVLTYTQGTWTHSDPQNTSAFTPAALLKPATRYTVRFSTVARDPSGNRLDQNRNGVGGEACDIGPPAGWDCLVWVFETAPLPPDTVPPKVASMSPPAGGNATTDAPIEIRFTETMDTASVEEAFSYGDGYSLYTVADGSVSWIATSSPDDTIRFSPRLEFASGGSIAVNLRGGTARDDTGNPLDGNGDGTGGDDFSWSFRVAANPTPPVVVYTHPSPGTGDNSISTSIRVTFSKSMATAGVEASLSLTDAGGPGLTAANGSFEWVGVRFPDDTLYFDPYPNFRTATEYTLRLRSNDAVDREGLRLDGNANRTLEGSPVDDFTLSFSTEAQDLTPPWVSERTPAAGATEVATSTRIRSVFSEPMDRGAVESAFSYSDGATTLRIADGMATWNEPSDEFTFLPGRALALGTTYTVTLNGSIAKDEAGNLLNWGQRERWSFTTVGSPDTTPPRILWTSPHAGQENVSRTARISIIFSEAMDPASVRQAMGITGGASLTDFRWPNDATVEAAPYAALAWRSPYAVFLLTGAKDLAGNSLTEPAEIAFTTEAWRGRVTGRVADEAGAGVAAARVQLNGLSVLTNTTGGFVFETVEQGTYTLTVSHVGYDAYATSVTIHPEEPPLGTVVLRRPTVSAIDATLWATVGGSLVLLLLIAVWFRRRRTRPTDHYETWKPAKVVVIEPGEIPPKGRP